MSNDETVTAPAAVPEQTAPARTKKKPKSRRSKKSKATKKEEKAALAVFKKEMAAAAVKVTAEQAEKEAAKDAADAAQARPFVERFYGAQQKTIASLMEWGAVLEDAKKELKPKGIWSRAFKDSENPLPDTAFPITLDTAERIIKVTRQKMFQDSVLTRSLPPHPTTLYELSNLSHADLRREIEKGRITPETTVDEARKLKDELYPPEKRKPVRSTPPSTEPTAAAPTAAVPAHEEPPVDPAKEPAPVGGAVPDTRTERQEIEMAVHTIRHTREQIAYGLGELQLPPAFKAKHADLFDAFAEKIEMRVRDLLAPYDDLANALNLIAREIAW